MDPTTNSVSGVRGRWGQRDLDAPDGLLARTRLGAVIIGCLALLTQIAQIGNPTKPRAYLALSLASLLMLVAMLLITHVRSGAQWWDVITLEVLVVLAGSGRKDPLSTIAITLGLIVVLALYGSWRLWLIRTIAGMAAIPVAALVSPDSYGRPITWHSPTVIAIMPQLLLVSVIMRGLYAALARTEQASAREEVLARSGRDMLAMTEIADVRARGLGAAGELCALSKDAAFLIIRRTTDGLRVINVAGVPDAMRGDQGVAIR